MSLNWIAVAAQLDTKAHAPTWGAELTPTAGQRNTVAAIADRLRRGQRSLLLADEVGMGKTLIAGTLIKAVQAEGGRAAVVIPPGLGAQWQAELRRLDVHDRTLSPLRGYWTFLDAFKQPKDIADRNIIRERRAKELADRRQQRQLPTQGWAEEPILLLSHTLGYIPCTKGTSEWHAALIDAVSKVDQGRRRYRRSPQTGAHHNIARAAAETILAGLDLDGRQALLKAMKEQAQPVDKLRHIIARGLGCFDLVVVDEAHKARGATTSLGHVLGPMTWETAGGFRLGMTATPVELDAQQWIDTLGRLNVPATSLEALTHVIGDYVQVVDDLRANVALTPEAVQRFRTVAERFQELLSPWVLRRDHREDSFLREFCNRRGSHREVRPIEISLEEMSPMWKRAFIAGEALSLLCEQNLTSAERRLRLSLPDGRRLSGMEKDPAETLLTPSTPGQQAWQALAHEATADGGDAIFSHPAITRTVTEIEALVHGGQKVLVFGRFTRPLRALTFLLDAREMVRRLSSGDEAATRWPDSRLPLEETERGKALRAALEDPALNVDKLNRQALEQRLDERASRRQAERRANLTAMRAALEQRASDERHARMLLEIWRDGSGDGTMLRGKGEAALLAALDDQRAGAQRHAPWTEQELLDAFASLLREVRSGNEDDDAEVSAGPDLTELLNRHLADFGAREGHFARLMDGHTAPQTRRLLQAAFNRTGSWPEVLVAQSAVGREGLNLQTACRVVVMLHLEWNPGNVEQQIGRVDRIGSRWRREAEEFLESGEGEVPRIVVRPVLVRGTYADHHWSVLKRRWEGLRAQLNGEILSPEDLEDDGSDLAALLEELRAAAPRFSPPARSQGSTS
jgi:hypothetical protein